jgi:hypothetical protein
VADDDDALFQLEFRPAPAPPPPTVLIRRKNHEVPIVMPEDHAFELYLVLRDHFEGKL